MTTARLSLPMNHTPDRPIVDRVPTWSLVLIGVSLTLLTGARWNIALLAWLAPVPYLLVARRLRTARGWLGLAAVISVATTAQVLKIVTAPVSPLLAPMFSLPAALGFTLILAATEWLRRRTGESLGVLAFASLVALMDLVGYATTELGAWTTSSTTQIGSVLVMQLASVVGLWGIGFLMAWIGALVAALLSGATQRLLLHAMGAALVLAGALTWATVRLERAQEGPSISAAAITTDLGLHGGGLPSNEDLARNTDVLFARSQDAAERGAKLVVWPEAATLVRPSEEAALLGRGRVFASERAVDLVLAYAVVLHEEPLSLDNKLAFITSEGEVADTYRKHHPVPGEPSLKGDDALRILARPYGNVGVAICYDYDFPAMAREHARLGASIVVVPASDWRGIDPVHTEMARARGIEGGFSVVRAVRWSTSAAFDAFGRVRGWLPGREPSKVLVADVPLSRVPTVYAKVGDTPALALALVLVGIMIRALRAKSRDAEPPRAAG